jgi:nuclear receptor subfamily 1 group D member 3
MDICFLSSLAVRFGRVPKREKARIEAAMQQSTRNRALTTNVWTDLEDLQHVIDTVVGAHLETCEFTRDRVREMKLRAKDSPNYTEPTRVSFPSNLIL